MDQLAEFFAGLFNTDLWPPRWLCGQWTSFHGWLYILSDLAIWISYFAIPVIILGYTARKKYELKYTTTYMLFAAFILLCGATHLIDAIMFWMPMYRFNALVRFITGVVSLFTVFHLIKILPDAFRQKTSLVLEREIAKRYEAERKLALANEELQAFAYMASHDLQEPLRKIRLFTGNLSEANADKFNDESKKWVDKTLTAADRMHRLIKDILKLSSLSDTIEMENVDLTDVITQVKGDLEVRIQDTDTIIEVGNLPAVKGSREYLVQMFTNLINNSIKFSQDHPRISITSSNSGGNVVISLQDNGIGMEPEDTGKIFRPFERLHGRAEYEGSGIGLAIVKKIIDLHQGQIRVESSPGKGTTFHITLTAG